MCQRRIGKLESEQLQKPDGLSKRSLSYLEARLFYSCLIRNSKPLQLYSAPAFCVGFDDWFFRL
jgi:hypothetical protein